MPLQSSPFFKYCLAIASFTDEGMRFQLKSANCPCDDLFLDILANNVVPIVQFDNPRFHGPIPFPSPERMSGLRFPSNRDRFLIFPFELLDKTVTDVRIRKRNFRTPAILLILFSHHSESLMLAHEEQIFNEITSTLTSKLWNLENSEDLVDELNALEISINDLLYQKFKEKTFVKHERWSFYLKEKLTALAYTWRNIKNSNLARLDEIASKYQTVVIPCATRAGVEILLSSLVPPSTDITVRWRMAHEAPHLFVLTIETFSFLFYFLDFPSALSEPKKIFEPSSSLISGVLTLVNESKQPRNDTMKQIRLMLFVSDLVVSCVNPATIQLFLSEFISSITSFLIVTEAASLDKIQELLAQGNIPLDQRCHILVAEKSTIHSNDMISALDSIVEIILNKITEEYWKKTLSESIEVGKRKDFFPKKRKMKKIFQG